MADFFFEEVELLLEAGHHLGSKAEGLVNEHIGHGLGHKGQDDLRNFSFRRDHVFPRCQDAFVIVRFFENLFKAVTDPIRFIPDDGPFFDVIEEGILLIVRRRQGHGQNPRPFGIIQRLLAVDVEGADAFQFIAKEGQAQGLRFIDGKDVDDVAADGKMASPFDHVDPFITGVYEVLQQVIAVVFSLDFDVDGRIVDALGSHDVLCRFFRRSQDENRIPLAQTAQGFHLPSHPVETFSRRRKDSLIDDGKVENLYVRRQKGQVRLPGRSLFPRRDDEDDLTGAFVQYLSDQSALDRAAEAVDAVTAGL